MREKRWFERTWTLIKIIILFIFSSSLSGLIGNITYAIYEKTLAKNPIFLSILSYVKNTNNTNFIIFLSELVRDNYLLVTFFIGGVITTLIIRFRYTNALEKSKQLFRLKQNYLDLINNICTGKDGYSFRRIVQSYIDDIVDFYPRILGAALFLPDSEDSKILNYEGKQGITWHNLSECKYYPYSDKPQERGAVGEAFIKQKHIIVNIKKVRKNGTFEYKADCEAYIFPKENDNTQDPGYKSMIAVPILSYQNGSEKSCHGVVSFYSKKKNAFNPDKNINEDISTELGSSVNNLYVAIFLNELI